MNKVPYSMLQDDQASLSQQKAGMTRLLTPAGGALVREWCDSVAATTGNIEFGISYNVNLNPTTGVWSTRDVANDVCWLEKWTDIGGVKEFWYAPAATGVPVWTKVHSVDMTTGRVIIGNGVNGNEAVAMGQVAQAAPVWAQTQASTTSVVATTGTFTAPSTGRLMIFAFGSSLGASASSMSITASLGALTTDTGSMVSNVFAEHVSSIEMTAGQSTTVTATYGSSDTGGKFVTVHTIFLPLV